MKTKFLALLLISFILFSCSKVGFKTHETGLKYRFIVTNPDNMQPKVGDVIAIKLRYTTSDGNVLDEYPLFRTQLKEPPHAGGSIEDGLAMMHEGDSAIFMVKAEDYYTFNLKQRVPQSIDPQSMLLFYVRLVDVTPYNDFARERQVAKISGEKEEEQLLTAFLQRSNITSEPTNSGLYYIETKTGNGPKAVAGKKVTVHYSGYFIDGQVFDSSYDRNEPFTFTLGRGEVIQGWDEGVAKMHVGGKAKLIIPSFLAYGDRQNGPIPPFATLVFDIELLEVGK